MRILPMTLIRQLRNYDRSLDILWNDRIERWVIVQKLPQPGPIADELLGCAAVTGTRNHYKFMMTCETEERLQGQSDRGIPLEPSASWIIPYLTQNFPTKQEQIQRDAPFGDPYHRAVRAREECEKAEKHRMMGDISSSARVDHRNYVKKDRKHFLIESV